MADFVRFLQRGRQLFTKRCLIFFRNEPCYDCSFHSLPFFDFFCGRRRLLAPWSVKRKRQTNNEHFCRRSPPIRLKISNEHLCPSVRAHVHILRMQIRIQHIGIPMKTRSAFLVVIKIVRWIFITRLWCKFPRLRNCFRKDGKRKGFITWWLG